MVREENGIVQKAKSFKFRKIFERRNTCRTVHGGKDPTLEYNQKMQAQNEVAVAVLQRMCRNAPSGNNDAPSKGNSRKDALIADMNMMKERFSKLLLGEDMSGGGKGVSSALALSNAITNLAASVFGEQRKLEPMDLERKTRWNKEVGWLLSVTDYIVEFVPSQQRSKEGTNMEIMTTHQRRDLRMNIPALRELDRMLIDTLDNFKGKQEFKYVSRNTEPSEDEANNEKWWLPEVKVPPGGLSEEARRFLQKQKESANQVLKASMAINSQIIADMDIPDSYIETLPRNGRESLGEIIYKSITDESFNPLEFLTTTDLSSDHKIVDLKNRVEASIVIWKRKMNQKDGRSSWASAISVERRELFEERAETVLLLLKQNFPGTSQSTLEISKIQYNRDVGMSIMESYSRVLETLASTVMSRIQEVLQADSLAEPSSSRHSEDSSSPSPTSSNSPGSSVSDRCSSVTGTPTPTSKATAIESVLSDDAEDDEITMSKRGEINTEKKFSYLDQIEMESSRSPTARH